MKTATPPLHSYRRRFETARTALIEQITEFWPQEIHAECLLAIRNAVNHPGEFDLMAELNDLSPYVLEGDDIHLIRALTRAIARLHRAELRAIKTRLHRAS